MGSKPKQGQIPTHKVIWPRLELILSGSCGRLLDHPNQGKFLSSTYLQSEVNCKTSSLRPEQEFQKGCISFNFHTDAAPITVKKETLKTCTKTQQEPLQHLTALLFGSVGK